MFVTGSDPRCCDGGFGAQTNQTKQLSFPSISAVVKQRRIALQVRPLSYLHPTPVHTQPPSHALACSFPQGGLPPQSPTQSRTVTGLSRPVLCVESIQIPFCPFRVFLGKPQGDLTPHTHTQAVTSLHDSLGWMIVVGSARVHPNPAQTRCHLGAGMWRGVSVLTVLAVWLSCTLSLSSLYSPLPPHTRL